MGDWRSYWYMGLTPIINVSIEHINGCVKPGQTMAILPIGRRQPAGNNLDSFTLPRCPTRKTHSRVLLRHGQCTCLRAGGHVLGEWRPEKRRGMPRISTNVAQSIYQKLDLPHSQDFASSVFSVSGDCLTAEPMRSNRAALCGLKPSSRWVSLFLAVRQ